MKRSSTLSVSLGVVAISVIGVALSLFLWRPPQTAPKVSAEQLTKAPQGSLVVEGWLQLTREQRYTRSYSVLGKLQTEALRVAPLTSQGWQPGDVVSAIAILREDAPSAFFQGPAVNLGPLDPSWEAPFKVSKDAVLIELIPGEPPAWLLALSGFALIVFFGIAARGLLIRLRA